MIWVPIICFGGLLIYLSFVIWEARRDVKGAPRAEMFVCDKHGAIPAKYCLKLIDDLDQDSNNWRDQQYADPAYVARVLKGEEAPPPAPDKKPLLYCPICFEDRMKEAKAKVK